MHKVMKACPFCRAEFHARAIWPHRKTCGQNPRNIASAPKPIPTKGPGSLVACRFCGDEVFLGQLRKHFAVCLRAPQLRADEMICSLCQVPKMLDDFPKHRVDRGKGRDYTCNQCSTDRAKNWYKNNVEKHRTGVRKRVYGLEEAEYQGLIESQDGKCAICRQPATGGYKCDRLHVDHDHQTKKVRGLLCYQCNHGIGSLKDSIPLLMSAIEYLRRHQEIHTVA